MEALIGVLGTAVIELVKCVYPSVALHVSYCIRSKKIVKKLESKVEELKATRTEVQNIVDEADNKLESIKKTVKDWFERVDKEISSTTPDDEAGSSSVNNGGAAAEMNGKDCCFCRTRYDIGRDAQKKMVIIEELITQGKCFDINNVSDPSPPVGTVFAPTNQDFEDFQSRKSSKNQIMAALKDDKTSLVGVYGMGGVGKTMLVNQVHKLVMEEKLFDAVAKITVSETVDLKKIQNEIASQLDCLEQLQKTEDTQTRAEMLRVRLTKQNQKILVILDDLWTTTELTDLSVVGIPIPPTSGSGATCWKVVITTRNLNVCDLLGSQKDIRVEALSEEESWYLFKKNVGEDVVTSTDLLQVARDVANECGGLPIAIVTLGKSLRNKEKFVWEDTLYQLKSSDFSQMEEINPKVSTSIKLSYNHLGNTFLKKCFLFCSLFPEDHRISIVELMMHVMGDDEILKDMAGSTLKQVRDRLHNMLDKLMASCLLFGHKEDDDGSISEVWMHDIVRYVALSIASEEGSGFLAKVGASLKEWPESQWLLSRSNTSKFLRVLLIRHEISVLLEQPQLPDNLLCLSLEGITSLKEIPDSFFQISESSLPTSLAALNLSETGISALPTSLSFLTNLRSLHLGKCDLHEIDLSVIGKLKKLEILNLSSCELSSLPEEIWGLSNLKLFDLSENRQLNFIPPNVIPKLSRLEELYMLDSFKRWKVEPTGDGTCASLSEVASLKCVQLDIENDEIKARISIGCGFRNQSYLSAPSPICHSIRVLLARVDHLKLSKCTGLKSVGQLVIDSVGFKNMKILRVEECNEMEYLMSVVEDCEKLKEEEGCMLNTFPKLKGLYLKYLPKLTIIWKGVFPIESFQYLEVMEVGYCHGLRYLFSTPAMVLALQQLEKLEICYCEAMIGIVSPPEEMVLKDQVLIPPHTMVLFPRLKKLVLWGLPNLMRIAIGVIMSFGSFQNLEELYVVSCNSLKHILPIRLLVNGGLPKLKKITVFECNEMEVIFNEDGGDHDQYNHSKSKMVVAFPHLQELTLISLPKLSKFHQGPPILDWPSLCYLEVRKCENLKSLPLNHPDSLFPKLEKIIGDSERWFEEELEWEDESLKSRLTPFFQVMVLFEENLEWKELCADVASGKLNIEENLEWKELCADVASGKLNIEDDEDFL